MDYKQNLFYAIKLLFMMVILVELSTVRMIIMPNGIHEYIAIQAGLGVYIEHIFLSIVFLCLGALIYLKKA